MRKFTYTFNANERFLLVFALARLFPELHVAPLETSIVPSAVDCMAVLNRLMEQPADPETKPANHETKPNGSETAKALLRPPAATSETAPMLRDRWARNRDGSECTEIPRDAESLTVEIQKVQPRGDGDKRRMVVSFSNPNGRGWLDAAAWDEHLFPFLANRVKQRTLLYVVRKDKYLNIVGVCA